MLNITMATQLDAWGELPFWYWKARYGSVEVVGVMIRMIRSSSFMMDTKISMKPERKPPLGQREHDLDEPAEEAGALDGGRLLQLAADLQHVGGAGAGGEGQVLHHGHQRQQGEGAVQGGHQGHAKDLLGLGEHGQVDAAEGHGGDQVGDEHQLPPTSLPWNLPRPLAVM